MKTIEYSFILKALSPIAQRSGTEGNVGILNRAPAVLPDGSLRDVPEVSGNAMRSGLRRAIAILTLDTLDMLEQGAFESRDPVRFLFNGGAGSGEGNTLRLDDVRAMNALIPSSALFGGSTRGMIHFGRLEVSPAVLICEETLPGLPQWQQDALEGITIQPSVVYETEIAEYQHDETAKPTGRFLLSEEAQRVLTERQSKRERATDADDPVAAEESKGGMRPYSTQALVKGSLFSWDVIAHVHNDIEEATFKAMVSAFLRRAVVGSGSRVGRGRLDVFAASGFDHLKPSEAVQRLATVAGADIESRLVEHLRSRADEAREWLRSTTS